MAVSINWGVLSVGVLIVRAWYLGYILWPLIFGNSYNPLTRSLEHGLDAAASRWGDLIDGLGASISADFDMQSLSNATAEQLEVGDERGGPGATVRGLNNCPYHGPMFLNDSGYC